jgi:hypothetical protein
MKLPHIKNNVVAQQSAEAVFSNLYEMQLTPPDGVPFVEHLTDEITSVGGLGDIEKLPETKVQKSRGHSRVYTAPMLDETHITLDLKINLNAHGPNAKDIVIYEMFKAWARLHRDDRDGSMGIKAECIGSGRLTLFNKKGFVFKKYIFKRMLIESIGWIDSVALDSGEPVSLDVKLVVEEFETD